MKTKEELKELKEKMERMKEELRTLTVEELEQIVGGVDPFGYTNGETGAHYPNVSRCDKGMVPVIEESGIVKCVGTYKK